MKPIFLLLLWVFFRVSSSVAEEWHFHGRSEEGVYFIHSETQEIVFGKEEGEGYSLYRCLKQENTENPQEVPLGKKVEFWEVLFPEAQLREALIPHVWEVQDPSTPLSFKDRESAATLTYDPSEKAYYFQKSPEETSQRISSPLEKGLDMSLFNPDSSPQPLPKVSSADDLSVPPISLSPPPISLSPQKESNKGRAWVVGLGVSLLFHYFFSEKLYKWGEERVKKMTEKKDESNTPSKPSFFREKLVPKMPHLFWILGDSVSFLICFYLVSR